MWYPYNKQSRVRKKNDVKINKMAEIKVHVKNKNINIKKLCKKITCLTHELMNINEKRFKKI